MNSAIQAIAERRIAQAIEEGKLQIDGWKNKPLPQDNDAFVPDDLKIAYKILKNGGFVPPEVETRKEITNLESLIAKTEDEHTRVKQMKKLSILMMKLDQQRSRQSTIEQDDDYYRKIVERISMRSDSAKS